MDDLRSFEDSEESRSGKLIEPTDPGDPMDIPIADPAPGAPSSAEILDDLREDRF